MTWNPFTALFDIQRTVHRIETRVDAMSEQQTEIDNDVAEIQASNSRIETEIANLQAANPALDLTALKAAVDAESAIVPPAPAP